MTGKEKTLLSEIIGKSVLISCILWTNDSGLQWRLFLDRHLIMICNIPDAGKKIADKGSDKFKSCYLICTEMNGIAKILTPVYSITY